MVLQRKHATYISKRVIIIGECYYELIVILGVLSLFDMLFVTTRFEYLICLCTLAVYPLCRFFRLLGVLPSCTFFSPFLWGALFCC